MELHLTKYEAEVLWRAVNTAIGELQNKEFFKPGSIGQKRLDDIDTLQAILLRETK